jgi:glutathione S-transferase
MKLYYKPGACSLASHIMLLEVGADVEIETVDTDAGQTESGRNYRDINPNGYVPALETDTGELLNEGVSILQYIADTHPENAYSPALGTLERTRLQQHLNFAAAELHKAWGPLFALDSTDAEQTAATNKVAAKFDYLDSVLSDGRQYLVNNQFSGADAYTFVLSFWANIKDIDLSNWPNLAAYVPRIKDRPATHSAMAAEGLL